MSETEHPARNGAETDESGAVGTPRRVLRTVTPPYRGRPDSEMTAIGLAYAAGLVILVVPLLCSWRRRGSP